MSTVNHTDTKPLQTIIERHQRARSSLIPILQDVQTEVGYLPPDAIIVISRYLKIPEAEIYGVATFYAQFRFKPIGRNLLTVCRGTACHVRGSAQILRELEKDLKIRAGETTSDMNFSIQTVACFGSCALAPVTVLNGKVYGRMNKAALKNLVEGARKSSRKSGKSKKRRAKRAGTEAHR